MEKIKIFTDGAAKGNPGPGGYGAVFLLGDKVLEMGARKDLTTNNEMELTAVVEALKNLPDETEEVEIYSDSSYVIEGATSWIFGWVKNGWKTKTGSDVFHREVWEELFKLLQKVKVNWHKVPGHVGIIGNERADKIASDFGERREVKLYDGFKGDYGYDIENVQYDEKKELERSSARKRQSQKAYSYISKIDGIVMKHKTWAECEARVKGEKGARYKKAISEEEEKEILESFNNK